jgi:hypothetical protein
MVFVFCFRANYPEVTEENMRECIHGYKRYNKIVEGVFGDIVRKNREMKGKKEKS